MKARKRRTQADRNRSFKETVLLLEVGVRVPRWIYALGGTANDADWGPMPRDARDKEHYVYRRLLTIKRAVARVEFDVVGAANRVVLYTADRRKNNRLLGTFDRGDILVARWDGDDDLGIKGGKWTNPQQCPWCLSNTGVKLSRPPRGKKNWWFCSINAEHAWKANK